MTKKEFIEELKSAISEEKSAEPYLSPLGGIRIVIKDTYYCPITFVCVHKKLVDYGIADWRKAASLLKLGPRLSEQIVQLADNASKRDARNELLKVCDLLPKVTA